MRHELQRQDSFLQDIRRFFAQRDIVEVHTVCLGSHTVVDPYIDSIACQDHGFLQTSPEYAMKKLLAQGSGDIFQIAHAFRNDPVTLWHRREFLMLEWYRMHWGYKDLLKEVMDLLYPLCPGLVQNISIKEQLYKRGYDVTSPMQWINIAHDLGFSGHFDHPVDALDFIIQSVVYDTTQQAQVWTIYEDFPIAMASHAWCDASPERFEIYYGAIEIANGCREETRYEILKERMELNKRHGRIRHKDIDIDEQFIKNSSTLGLVSGVAVGLDRIYSAKYAYQKMVSMTQS